MNIAQLSEVKNIFGDYEFKKEEKEKVYIISNLLRGMTIQDAQDFLKKISDALMYLKLD